MFWLFKISEASMNPVYYTTGINCCAPGLEFTTRVELCEQCVDLGLVTRRQHLQRLVATVLRQTLQRPLGEECIRILWIGASCLQRDNNNNKKFFFSFILFPLLCGVDVRWHTSPCSTVVHIISRQSLLFDVILYFVQPSSFRSSSLPSPLYFHNKKFYSTYITAGRGTTVQSLSIIKKHRTGEHLEWKCIFFQMILMRLWQKL